MARSETTLDTVLFVKKRTTTRPWTKNNLLCNESGGFTYYLVFCGIKSNFTEKLIMYIMLLKTQKKCYILLCSNTHLQKNAFMNEILWWCGELYRDIIQLKNKPNKHFVLFLSSLFGYFVIIWAFGQVWCCQVVRLYINAVILFGL